jgi:hypothetical protein
VIVSNVSWTNTTVQCFVSSGQANSTYQITAQIILTDSQIWNRSVFLPVQVR